MLAQLASFVDLFVWLLVLKSFFLPLFIIPTGSMAETLAGAHADNVCPNCGYEYMIGPYRWRDARGGEHSSLPREIQCPNCHWLQDTERPGSNAVKLKEKAGDRIMVHGWAYPLGGPLGPQRWDVVVFKNPNARSPSTPDANFIKRLIGLPGETIEIVNGDVFITRPGQDHPQIAHKTSEAQKSLWFPYYNHDYPPRDPADQGYYDRRGPVRYLPHFAPVAASGEWTGLDTRTPRFTGLQAPRSEIIFATKPGDPPRPGLIVDQYGYNGPRRTRDHTLQHSIVSDVRIGTDVAFEAGDGFVELNIARYDRVFFTRLYADGRLTLTMISPDNPDGAPLVDATRVAIGSNPQRLTLAHVDGTVRVGFAGHTVLESDSARYQLDIDTARRQEARPRSPRIGIAAEGVVLRLSHLLVERDVHYSRVFFHQTGRPGNGVSGNPITLPDDAYFVMGDNSPASQDGRLWSPDMLGPHLRQAYQRGEYKVGTVPARDMIGHAFLVYWPGFMPIGSSGPHIVPDAGRIRWIH